MIQDELKAKIAELDRAIQQRVNVLVSGDPATQNYLGQKTAYESMIEKPKEK